MMKKLFLIFISLFSLFVFSQVAIGSLAYACTNGGSGSIDICTLPTPEANKDTLALILNIVFSIIGAIAVLMMVIAGFKFITSSGKPEEVAKAKDTIIYSSVGLIICIFAVTIVSFVAGYI